MILNFLISVVLSYFISQQPNIISIKVEIEGIRNEKGCVMLQVLDEMQNVAAQAKAKITGDRCIMVIDSLKAGTYAIQYFHDENISGKMEKNSLGIPVEGWGFSNNAYGLFGPKPFRERLLRIDSNKIINLKIRY